MEDNLRRVELGLLGVPVEADPVVFLLSDGKAVDRPSATDVRSLGDLFERYFKSIPVGALDESTISGMHIRYRRLIPNQQQDALRAVFNA